MEIKAQSAFFLAMLMNKMAIKQFFWGQFWRLSLSNGVSVCHCLFLSPYSLHYILRNSFTCNKTNYKCNLEYKFLTIITVKLPGPGISGMTKCFSYNVLFTQIKYNVIEKLIMNIKTWLDPTLCTKKGNLLRSENCVTWTNG